MKKAWWWGAALAVVAIGAYYGFQEEPAAPPDGTAGGSGETAPVPPAVAPAPARNAVGQAAIKQLLERGEAKAYERLVLTDPKSGIEVARTLMPAGWKGTGQVSWTMQSASNPAEYFMQAMSPGEQAAVLRMSNVSYVDPLSMTMMGRSVPREQLYQEGAYDEETGTSMLRLMSPPDYVQRLIRRADPSIQDIQVTQVEDAGSSKDLADLERDVAAAFDAAMAQVNRQLAAQGVPGQTAPTRVKAAITHMKFSQKGKALRASAFATVVSSQLNYRSPSYTKQTLRWSVPFVLMYSAVPDAYERERGSLQLFAENFSENQQWQAAVSRAVSQLNAQRLQAAQKRTEASRRFLQEQTRAASQSIQSNFDSIQQRSQAQSSVLAGWGNVTTLRDNYRAPDGGVMKVDSNYSNVYTDSGNSTIYATRKGVELDPNRFRQLERLPNVLPAN